MTVASAHLRQPAHGTMHGRVTPTAASAVSRTIRAWDGATIAVGCDRGSRFLQTDPIEGGSGDDYDYTCTDPINAFDLTGLFFVDGYHAATWAYMYQTEQRAARHTRRAAEAPVRAGDPARERAVDTYIRGPIHAGQEHSIVRGLINAGRALGGVVESIRGYYHDFQRGCQREDVKAALFVLIPAGAPSGQALAHLLRRPVLWPGSAL